MAREELENEEQEQRALREAKGLAEKKSKNLTKKVILKIAKAAVACIPMLIMLVKIIAIILLVLSVISLFALTIEGDSSPADDSSLQDSTEMSNLQAYLFQFSHSGALSVPQSDDGKYYKMYSDGIWLTIGNSDLRWEDVQDRFDCEGNVLTADGVEMTVESVKNYVNNIRDNTQTSQPGIFTVEEAKAMNIYIEKELVDNIGTDVANEKYQTMCKYTSGLNLSKQQLYALIAVSYSFGHLPERNGYTFLSVYNAAASQYGINTWEFNKFIWDHWWAYLGGGSSVHIPARDAQFETYVKGIYDFQSSDAGMASNRKYYIYYTEDQLSMFDYAKQISITRSDDNEEEIFTYNEVN